jgi:hypothetical protein
MTIRALWYPDAAPMGSGPQCNYSERYPQDLRVSGDPQQNPKAWSVDCDLSRAG